MSIRLLFYDNEKEIDRARLNNLAHLAANAGQTLQTSEQDDGVEVFEGVAEYGETELTEKERAFVEAWRRKNENIPEAP